MRRDVSVNDLLVGVLGMVVPPRCPLCAAPCRTGQVLCARCAARLERLDAPLGALRLTTGGLTITAALPYEGAARELITALKFRGRSSLARLAAEIICARIETAPGSVLVPVPADPLRRRLRGHDPAAALAREISKLSGTSWAPVLRRPHGARQVGRSRAERRSGPAGVTAVESAPESCVLVDDVVTTGATLRACATALERTGTAADVCGLAFARTL